MKFLIPLVAFLSFTVSSNDLIEIFNLNIKDGNFLYTQSSINPYTNSIDKSEGIIRRTPEGIMVKVNTPFKEKYELNSNEIIITDVELGQVSTIALNDFDKNPLIEVFVNGLNANSENYKLDFKENTILISSLLDEGYNEIEVRFKDNNLYYLKYNDNLNIENLIMFDKLKDN